MICTFLYARLLLVFEYLYTVVLLLLFEYFFPTTVWIYGHLDIPEIKTTFSGYEPALCISAESGCCLNNTQSSFGRFHHPIPTTGAQMSLLVDNKSSVTKQPLLPEWQISLMTPKCHFCWDNKWLFAGHKVGMRECWFSWCWAFIKLPPHNCSCWINIKPAVHMQPACGASQVKFPWNSVFHLWKK